ncbi:ATPase family gene 2 protein homolog B-like [Saccoglossus kowalevskii]|uniref:Spermatogenesis-associated protein 5-like protein 1-like n=1 Tax=Saccoglossus kowalevskii TaxID=10224 RepID=A0ABM0MDN8_SACKO|nr:PREDICTED: spermatogenesis-associated protein 5-like protein 1-like [Saccoglossus kowalevskii]
MDAADRDLMVTVLPIDPKNLGSQKCHIGPKMMKDLSLNMGTWVCITWQGCEVLCQIWPRSDLCEEYVQCDTTVYRTINPEKSRVSPSMLSGTIHKSNMKKLKVTKLNCVSVSLVSQRSTDEAIHYALDDSCLSDYIHNILVNHALFQNSVVRLQDLDHCGAHRYTRITHIIIKHFDIAGQQNSGKKSSNVKKVGIVSMSTKVKIVGQMSNERFEGQSVQCSYGGLENPAKMLKEYISYPFVYQESFKRLGLECPKGVLLHGPTGVGKTLLVRAVCAECNAFIVQINGPEIIGPHPGESEENLRKIFQKANRLSEEGPTVLFIDELDALCPKRGHGSRGHENRIVAQLLTLMDGLETREKLIVIGATNRPNAIDVALRRPGRFDIEVSKQSL